MDARGLVPQAVGHVHYDPIAYHALDGGRRPLVIDADDRPPEAVRGDELP